MTDKIYKIEEAGAQWIYHYMVLMLGSLKDVELLNKINVCFDNENFTSYQKQTFEVLSDIINVVPKTNNFKLLSSIKPLHNNNGSGQPFVDHNVYHFLRKLFLSRVGNDFDTTEYDKVYIRRSRSHLCVGNKGDNNVRRRQVINEDELVQSLNKIGIKSIFFEDYTVSEKIQIFRDASLVVAPQSGGLVFTLFANKDIDIIEIYPPNPHQFCDQYIDICRALNIPFRRFTDIKKVDGLDNMIVDISNLNNFILKK